MVKCKKCVVGVVIDDGEDDAVFIYENENVELELIFDFCPRCGEKIEKKDER